MQERGEQATATPEKGWEKERKQRTLIVAGGLVLFVGLIVLKLMAVQVVNSSEYQVRAKKQYEYRSPLSATRGAIYDRDMQKLATSITLISFAADPKIFDKPEKRPGEKKERKPENPERVADSLAKVFGRGRDFYLKKLKEKSRFVWLERNVRVDIAKRVSEMHLPGVHSFREQNRYYENIAAQVIGFTDRDNNGISGIEKQFDADLRGKDGLIIMQRTATGKAYPAVDKPLLEPVDGNSVQLTIDMNIQAIAEAELKRGIVAAGAQAGIAIVMDVRTGEILAMSNQPDFDMNNKATYGADLVRNRAITDSYEPGSTFKLVMATAATELGLRKAETPVFAENGRYKIYGQTIEDHEKLGNVTFKMAIAHSSNIIAAKTALDIGPEKFYNYAHAFGFGEKTGIDLIGEVSGKLKPVNNWGKTTLPWMAQGYEVLVTPLQILCAYAALANDGVLMKPYIVKRVLSPTGDVIKENNPAEIHEVMSSKTARYVRNYFKTVVDSGTGMSAAIEGLDVGGKTGTAQQLIGGNYRTGSYVSTFVGFFPVDKPEVATIVMMINPTNGYYGSMVSAPVFSKIGGRIVTTSEQVRKRIASTELKPSKESLYLDSVKTVIVPNVRGLTADEAKSLLKLHNLDYKKLNDDEGVVVAQGVAAGKRVALWTKVPIEFAQPQTDSKMPNLVGLGADRAVATVEQLGLRVRISGAGGKVASQWPQSGAKVADGQSCILRMSN